MGNTVIDFVNVRSTSIATMEVVSLSRVGYFHEISDVLHMPHLPKKATHDLDVWWEKHLHEKATGKRGIHCFGKES